MGRRNNIREYVTPMEKREVLESIDLDNLHNLSVKEVIDLGVFLNLHTEAYKFKGMDTASIGDKLEKAFGRTTKKIKDSILLSLSQYHDSIVKQIAIKMSQVDDIDLPSELKIDKFLNLKSSHKAKINRSVLDTIYNFYREGSSIINSKLLRASASLSDEFSKLEKSDKFEYYLANKKALSNYSIKYFNMGGGKVLMAFAEDSEYELTSKVKTKVINAPELSPIGLTDEFTLSDLNISTKTIEYFLDIDKVKKDLQNYIKDIERDIEKIKSIISHSESEEAIKDMMDHNDYLHAKIYARLSYYETAIKASVYIVDLFTKNI